MTPEQIKQATVVKWTIAMKAQIDSFMLDFFYGKEELLKYDCEAVSCAMSEAAMIALIDSLKNDS